MAIKTFGNELQEIKNYLQQELIPTVINITKAIMPPPQQEEEPQIQEQLIEPAIQLDEVTKPKHWTCYVDEIKQKMNDNNWDIYEVCKRANIAYGSFRKFEKKSQKLSLATVNKILQLFNITN